MSQISSRTLGLLNQGNKPEKLTSSEITEDFQRNENPLPKKVKTSDSNSKNLKQTRISFTKIKTNELVNTCTQISTAKEEKIQEISYENLEIQVRHLLASQSTAN